MHSTYNFHNRWGDSGAIERLKASDKSDDVYIAEITNLLVDLAQRFDRAPGRDKLAYWASDIVKTGARPHQIEELIPKMARTMERYPTLSQIFDLLASARRQTDTDDRDPQTIKDQEEMAKLRAKWDEVLGPDIMPIMCRSYAKNVLKLNIEQMATYGFNSTLFEMLVLLDWKRSGFGNAEAILRQGLVSQSKSRKENLHG